MYRQKIVGACAHREAGFTREATRDQLLGRESSGRLELVHVLEGDVGASAADEHRQLCRRTAAREREGARARGREGARAREREGA